MEDFCNSENMSLGREGRREGGREESIKKSVLPLPHSGMLKWKRGRLLGKGAYGKVWEGLMDSAKMIAVKEVELDCESVERAQAVSPGGNERRVRQ